MKLNSLFNLLVGFLLLGMVSCDDGEEFTLTHEINNYRSLDLGIGNSKLSGEWMNYNFNGSIRDNYFNLNKTTGANADSVKMLKTYAYSASLNDSIGEYLGAEYRLPTLKEFINLLETAAHKETQCNGVGGYVFKHSEKTIFLPYGTYLTSTFVSGEIKRVFAINIAQGNITYEHMGQDTIKGGNFIRPVRKLPSEMK